MTGEPDCGALSVEEIEQDAWGGPPDGATRLIRTAFELRRKPVAELTVEDLRLLIGQQIGADVLVPCALDVLASDPLAEGDMYPGDLLIAVMRLPQDYWAARPGQAAALRKIAGGVKGADPHTQSAIDVFIALSEQLTLPGQGRAT